MTESLVPKSEFTGLENIVHLATGGESPMLKSHRAAMNRFIEDKALGQVSRQKQVEVMQRAREKCAALFSVDADEITFLSSASEGINNVVYGLEWRPGDNVVVADVEFPSGVLPWTRLAPAGVELRIVRHRNWDVSIDDIAAQLDRRTRVVAISHVSMFTGQRIDLPILSELVRANGTLLLLDASHSAGVVPVDTRYADIMVSSCYKWMLGIHGTAVFYCNRATLPEFSPPFLGWRSAAMGPDWRDPVDFRLKDDADRFLPGNPGFVGIYVLENALDLLLRIGSVRIERHALALSGTVLQAAKEMGMELMTPDADAERAGNVCLMVEDTQALQAAMVNQGILIWGAYAGADRLRISTHLYNDSEDTERCIDALSSSCR